VAKPPEPLAEILALAVVVVDATVAEIVRTGDTPAQNADAQHGGGGGAHPEQSVRLDVARVLRGQPASPLTVTKPPGAYLVKVGTTGAWLVDDAGVILGRYGPDSWSLAKVVDAVAR
jgi:hypothetical protein